MKVQVKVLDCWPLTKLMDCEVLLKGPFTFWKLPKSVAATLPFWSMVTVYCICWLMPTLAGALAVQFCAAIGAMVQRSRVMRVRIFFITHLSARMFYQSLSMLCRGTGMIIFSRSFCMSFSFCFNALSCLSRAFWSSVFLGCCGCAPSLSCCSFLSCWSP